MNASAAGESRGRPPSPHLDCFQVVAQTMDSEFLVVGVLLVDLAKLGAPDRHFDRSMRRDIRAELQHMDHVRFRKSAMVVLAQHRQIDRRSLVLNHNGAVTLSIDSVTRRAERREHLLAIGGGDRIDWGGRQRFGLAQVPNANRNKCENRRNRESFSHDCLSFENYWVWSDIRGLKVRSVI